MRFQETLGQLYFDMTVSALRQLHRSEGPNISYNTVMYLDIISFRPGCTTSYLARTLRISRPAVTAKVNELVRQGFVVKTQSGQDRRVFHLRVSDRVEATLREADRPYERAIRRLEREYSPAQLEDFCGILHVFSEEYNREDISDGSDTTV